MKPFILASASPRRRELLSQLITPFEVIPSRYREEAQGLTAVQTVAMFSRGKAEEVFSRYPDAYVLGADTVVSLNGEILGKPKDAEDAARMLRRLSGREHSVYTGICLLGGLREYREVAETKVRFYSLSDQTIQAYVQSGLPMDKSGAYGIQDGFLLVKDFTGSYSNVVGLPLERLNAILKDENIC